MRPYRSLAGDTASAARVPALVLATLVLTLLSGLPACSGASEDGAPLGAAETSAPTAGPVEPPTPATSAPAPETAHPPATPPDPPLPEPVEPGAPAASPPTDDPTTPASEEAPVPVAETTPLLYDTYDLSGAVSDPGRYAFLADPNDPTSAVTTYEELRDGTATALLIHTHDAHGVPHTDLYDAVESGDLFEWRQAADCFVRYQVTAVQLDPTGTVPRKLLTVAWMTYAFAGCSGAIATSTAATLDWSALPELGGESLTTPVRHGPWQIVPQGMTSVREELVSLPHLALEPSYTEDLATARQLPRWRDPALPDGWIFLNAIAGVDRVVHGYRASWSSTSVGVGLVIEGKYASYRGLWEWASWRTTHDKLGVHATRLIAGRPALVRYSPLGPNHNPLGGAVVWIYDAATESEYRVSGKARSLRGPNIEALIAIARSLFANPPLLHYGTYDATGAVSEPGHYAFLTDPGDPTSVVATYEELRDGTATALLIHTRDAHGIPQTALYDAVEPGDLFEWRQASDCFVRYQVTEVQPQPHRHGAPEALGRGLDDLRLRRLHGGHRYHDRRHPGLGRVARLGGDQPDHADSSWALPTRAGGLDGGD